MWPVAVAIVLEDCTTFIISSASLSLALVTAYIRQPAKIMMLYLLLSATAVIGFISLFIAELTWPSSFPGWLALCGSSALYVVATLFLFKAVDLVGSLQTAIIDNTAPVWAMIVGILVLGQWLTVQQVIGASVTVAAVMLLQWIAQPKTGSTL